MSVCGVCDVLDWEVIAELINFLFLLLNAVSCILICLP